MTSYIATFGRVVQQLKGADMQRDRETGRQYVNISSSLIGFQGRKAFYNVDFNMATWFVCPCMSVCGI